MHIGTLNENKWKLKNGAKSKMLKNTWTFEKVEMQILYDAWDHISNVSKKNDLTSNLKFSHFNQFSIISSEISHVIFGKMDQD